jgi:hypothetical protein
MTTRLAVAASPVAAALALAVAASPAVRMSAAVPPLYKNCTNLNKKYPHGLGRANARDKTSEEPVTNFRRSTRLYRIAMSHNKGLDRDKDGIACEKK